MNSEVIASSEFFRYIVLLHTLYIVFLLFSLKKALWNFSRDTLILSMKKPMTN